MKMSDRQNKFERSNKYFGHDDRMQEGKFNKGRGYRGKRPYRAGFNGRQINMRDEGPYDNSNRRAFYDRARGRGRGRGRNVYNNHSHQNSYSGWNEIIIKNVQGADGDEVIATIRKYVDADFSPILPKFVETTTFQFFMEDSRSTANAMLNLSNRITLDNGQKLKINVFDTCPTYTKPNEEKYEIIKKVMSDRYSVEMNRIDLKNFHNDPKLIQSKIFVPLFSYEALTTVVEIMKKNIPQVTDVDLSYNKIYNPTPLEPLSHCNVHRLNLGHNRIVRMALLGRLRKLQLTELNLTGNGIINGHKGRDTYISMVRKTFPKLQYLDGEELPKIIGFEINDLSKIPPSLGSQYCSEEAKGFVKQFIEQFYQIYECGNRRLLEAAYTEDACLSILSVIPDHTPQNKHQINMNKAFNKFNRNLLKGTDAQKRFVTLIQGKRNIVDTLCELPSALHNPASFVIDVPIAQPQLLHVALRGVVTLVNGTDKILRSFARSMVIIPVGSGFCISNEEFFIGLPSPEQKVAISQKAIIQALPSNSNQPISPPVTQPSGLTDIQMEMVKQFSEKSKMRLQFSKECLERNLWNFEKAAEIFMSLKNENKIPIEYYEA